MVSLENYQFSVIFQHFLPLTFLKSGSNLDLLYIQQLDAATFRENQAKLYFDAKHLETGLNRVKWEAGEIFGAVSKHHYCQIHM